MPQTLSLNLVHIVFSTKDRQPLIPDHIAVALHAYLAGTARRLGCKCFRTGGIADHVHLALRLSPTSASAKIVSELKTSSSAWMKQQGVPGFSWQRGYGLFSAGPADLPALVNYIDNQKTHHTLRTYQDELRGFCAKYHVAIDERFAWS